jgi:HTH-type transcriptional regulator / antitoxin HipB
MTVTELGRGLRASRKKSGLTQRDLASLAGVGTRFLSELENGKPTLEIGRVLRVIEMLGLELLLQARDWQSLQRDAHART